MKKVYLVGSMKNPEVPRIAKMLRAEGFEVFDDWYSPGPEADDYWKKYEEDRGRTFLEALEGTHCWNVFNYDKKHLDDADICILILPAGRSGHLELGYMVGCGKPCYILLDGDHERFDVMYRFATQVFDNVDKMLEVLKEL